MQHANNPVIVLGGGEANGLGIARSLGVHGISVYCVTSNPEELMRYSRYCRGSHVVPHIEDDPAILAAWLTSMRPKWRRRSLIFATTDTALLTLATLHEELEGYIPVIPRPDLVETMVRKSRFYTSLAEHAVPHPRTILPTEEHAELASQIPYPVFLRPVESLPFVEQFGVKGFVAHNHAALQHYLQLAQTHHLDLLVQEIIPGPPRHGYLLRGYLDQQSQPRALLATQKLRQPDMFATNTGLISISLTEFKDGVAMLLRYFRAIGYQGLFGAEFKRDPRDGVLKLLEVNARSQGGNYVGVACGVPHILIAYHDSLGNPVPPITGYRRGIYYSGLLLDAWSILQMAQRGELRRQDLRDYLRPQHWNYISRDDPRPFIKHLCRMGSRLRSTIH